MKLRFVFTMIAGVVLIGPVTSNNAKAACTQTGFTRDNVNMTAAVIANGDISGQIIDATGCNIGIYYGPGTTGTVDNTEVYGANYFGIVVSGDKDSFSNGGAVSVDVTNSKIHDIGETPLNGTQHGVGIYYRAFDAGASATGTISGNQLSNYQKGGIVANGPGTAASVSGNTVMGQGPVNYIAQNGIQIGYGATGQIMRNAVTGNAYTGTNDASSAGILIFGGCGYPTTNGVQIVKNTIGSSLAADGNDLGVALANYDPNCAMPPTTVTNDKVINNTITDAEVTNVSGNCTTAPGSNCGYQAGIYDSGVNDKLINNNIAGTGYASSAPCNSSQTPTETCQIDTTTSTGAKVHANTFGP